MYNSGNHTADTSFDGNARVVSISDASLALSKLISWATVMNQPVVITEDDMAVAVLLDVEAYQHLLAAVEEAKQSLG